MQYAITDRRMFPGDEHGRQLALVHQATRLALALNPVQYLQLREKDLPLADLTRLAQRIRAALHALPPVPPEPATSPPPSFSAAPLPPGLLLNGPVEIAIATGADGVHLPSGATAQHLDRIHAAFAHAGRPTPIVSTSCHTLAEVTAANAARFDLLLFGPIFEKRVHGQLITPGLGLDQLHQAANLATHSRLLALGGITLQNTPQCLAAGAHGIAAIRLFL